MANEEQLAILKQGVKVWNKWRKENPDTEIDLYRADLNLEDLVEVNLAGASLFEASLFGANLFAANLNNANLNSANLTKANLTKINLTKADLRDANLSSTLLLNANLNGASLYGTNLNTANLDGTSFLKATMSRTTLTFTALNKVINIENVNHGGPSTIGIETLRASKGKVSEVFLRGCGLSDWEIESAKLYTPELSNEAVNKILYKIYDLRASQAIQIFPLFISYSHGDASFVDKLESHLNKRGIRFWRDIHDMKSGKMEKQIDQAMRLNPIVLLILSEHSLQSDWVEYEVRTARALEKEMKRDTLCPVALDDSWKNSPWAKRIMEQIMEYNILNFSEWKDDTKFESTFNKLIDGLELFYK